MYFSVKKFISGEMAAMMSNLSLEKSFLKKSQKER